MATWDTAMRYPPEQVELLAAEYVAGTLRGPARRRFETLMRQRADVRQAVWDWEKLAHRLTACVEPVAPPDSLWRRIDRQIDGSRDPAVPQRRPWQRFSFATAVVAALAFWLGSLFTSVSQPERIAVFADDGAQTLWVVSADADTGRLIVDTEIVAPPDGTSVYELWALPAGGAPQSLGLLATVAGRYESDLSPALVAAIERSANLAISIEPAGGSPTGAPTGPVVFQAAVLRL